MPDADDNGRGDVTDAAHLTACGIVGPLSLTCGMTRETMDVAIESIGAAIRRGEQRGTEAARAEVERLTRERDLARAATDVWLEQAKDTATQLVSERERVERLRAWGFALEGRPVEAVYVYEARAHLHPGDLPSEEASDE